MGRSGPHQYKYIYIYTLLVLFFGGGPKSPQKLLPGARNRPPSHPQRFPGRPKLGRKMKVSRNVRHVRAPNSHFEGHDESQPAVSGHEASGAGRLALILTVQSKSWVLSEILRPRWGSSIASAQTGGPSPSSSGWFWAGRESAGPQLAQLQSGNLRSLRVAWFSGSALRFSFARPTKHQLANLTHPPARSLERSLARIRKCVPVTLGSFCVVQTNFGTVDGVAVQPRPPDYLRCERP